MSILIPRLGFHTEVYDENERPVEIGIEDSGFEDNNTN